LGELETFFVHIVRKVAELAKDLSEEFFNI
jgi:hypothetical protein